MKSLKPYIIALLIVLALAIGGTILFGKDSSTVPVTLNLQTPDTTNLTVKIDGKIQMTDRSNSVINVEPGDHQLTVDKLHYESVKTSFTATAGTPVTLTLQLQRDSQPSLTSWQQVQNSQTLAAGGVLGPVKYFYDQTWALTKVSIGANTATVVLHYNDSNAVWEAKLGPGTLFMEADVTNLPTDVTSYMRSNQYLVNEDTP